MRAQIGGFFALLVVFFLLTLMLIWVIGVKQVKMSGEVMTLLTTALTAAITLLGQAVQYFFNRHRPQTLADDGDTTPTPIQPPQAAKS